MMGSSDNFAVMAVTLILNIYWFVLLARLIVDLVPGLRWTLAREYGYLFRATEPVVRPFRRLAPPAWGIDLSMLASMVSVLILKELVVFVARSRF